MPHLSKLVSDKCVESTTLKDSLEGQSVVNTVLVLKKKLDPGPKIPYQALAIFHIEN